MGGTHSDRWGRWGRVADVVVWEADGRDDRHGAGRHGYGRPIVRRLQRSGLSVQTVRLTERAPTESEMTAPVHVLSGGNTAVDADVAWLAAARERLAWVLEFAMAGHATVTGICFGSQLIAHLLAGPSAVGPHPGGLQAGLVDVHGGGDAAGVVSSFHFHRIRRNEVMRAGGRVLLRSDRTEVQAYAFGDRVRGVQFHPELTPNGLRTTLRTYRDVLEHHGTDPVVAETSIRDRGRDWTDRLWSAHVLEPAIATLRRAA